MTHVFAVLRSRGSSWDESQALERQADWTGHAAFMDTRLGSL